MILVTPDFEGPTVPPRTASLSASTSLLEYTYSNPLRAQLNLTLLLSSWNPPSYLQAGLENGRPKPVSRAGREKSAAMSHSVDGRVQTATWTTSLVWSLGGHLGGEYQPGISRCHKTMLNCSLGASPMRLKAIPTACTKAWPRGHRR